MGHPHVYLVRRRHETVEVQTVIFNESYSSTQKSESLEDTIRTAGQYVDATVLRHPDEDAVHAAAGISPVPNVNGVNGAKKHPAQGLFDMFTIKEELGNINGLMITWINDLRFGRTAHALCKILQNCPEVTTNLYSPSTLEMPSELPE